LQSGRQQLRASVQSHDGWGRMQRALALIVSPRRMGGKPREWVGNLANDTNL